MSVGDRLRFERQLRKMTLADVAKRVGVSLNYIAKLEKEESSNPSDQVIIKLSETLGIDENDLFQMFGKIPIGMKEMLMKNPELTRSISEIGTKKPLTDSQKKKFEEKISELYIEYGISKWS